MQRQQQGSGTHGRGGEFPQDLTGRPQHNGGVWWIKYVWGMRKKINKSKRRSDDPTSCWGMRAAGNTHLRLRAWASECEAVAEEWPRSRLDTAGLYSTAAGATTTRRATLYVRGRAEFTTSWAARSRVGIMEDSSCVIGLKAFHLSLGNADEMYRVPTWQCWSDPLLAV